MQLSRRNFIKGAALATIGGAGIVADLSSPLGNQQAFADPVASGSIGLTFDGANWALVGQGVTSRVYPYDNGGKLQVVIMVDPASVDYSNLLTVTVIAANSSGDDSINLIDAKATKQGGTVALTILGDNNNIGVRVGDPISEFTVEALSLAMTFFMVDTTSTRWPDAARFDLNADGLIDITDFVRIANGILDAASNTRLRFKADGTFKILFNAMLDSEQPDLVVMTGDQIGGNMNADLLQD